MIHLDLKIGRPIICFMPIQILQFVGMVTLILGKGKSCDPELQQTYYVH